MSDINHTVANPVPEYAKPKIFRARKPKITQGNDSYRPGVNPVASAKEYGPCSLEITIASVSVVGTDEESQAVRDFCESFAKHSEICAVKGYGITDRSWQVKLDLATDGQDVGDQFVSNMFREFKADFDESPVLKREFGAGKAKYQVLNGGTTVESRDLN